jgi:hypothetical protein
MKLFGISALLLFWMAFTEAHPLHLSITNITYENGKLKISMKTFHDDWEVAYFHYHGTLIDFSTEENRKNPWLSSYLEDRFAISSKEGEAPIGLSIDSIFINDDSMQIEMRADLRGKPNSLYIYNALLIDIFPDQSNLVIFEFKENEIGMKFDIRKLREEVELK